RATASPVYGIRPRVAKIVRRQISPSIAAVSARLRPLDGASAGYAPQTISIAWIRTESSAAADFSNSGFFQYWTCATMGVPSILAILNVARIRIRNAPRNIIGAPHNILRRPNFHPRKRIRAELVIDD